MQGRVLWLVGTDAGPWRFCWASTGSRPGLTMRNAPRPQPHLPRGAVHQVRASRQARLWTRSSQSKIRHFPPADAHPMVAPFGSSFE